MKKKPQKIKPYYEVAEPEEQYSVVKETDVHKLADKILKAIGEDQQKKALLLGLLVSDVATKKEFSVLLEELKAMREASDKRFEASEKRFEAIETELKLMREDSDKKFEASQKRFEAIESELKAMREASDKRFEQQRQDFQLALRTSIEALDKSLTSKIDRLGSRWGIMAENTFTNALKEVLTKAGFEVSKWRKTDTNGEYFIVPRDAEIDILVRDGKRIAIEVKSSVGIGDVENFERTIRFYERSEQVKIDEKIMVGIYKYRDVSEYASKLGIKIVSEIDEIVEDKQN